MHRDRHPSYVEGCYTCKLLTVSISAAATPTRSGPVVAKLQSDQRFARDGAAYKRLRKEGLQPDHIDGCAEIEQRAEHKVEVEEMTLLPKGKAQKVAELL